MHFWFFRSIASAFYCYVSMAYLIINYLRLSQPYPLPCRPPSFPFPLRRDSLCHQPPRILAMASTPHSAIDPPPLEQAQPSHACRQLIYFRKSTALFLSGRGLLRRTLAWRSDLPSLAPSHHDHRYYPPKSLSRL